MLFEADFVFEFVVPRAEEDNLGAGRVDLVAPASRGVNSGIVLGVVKQTLRERCLGIVFVRKQDLTE